MSDRFYPVAIGLTEQWGWIAIYEGFDFRGLTFEKVFWLSEPSEELGMQVSVCEQPEPLPGGPNMLLPSIYRAMAEITFEFDLEKIKKLHHQPSKTEEAAP
jgi:hypothetical protein